MTNVLPRVKARCRREVAFELAAYEPKRQRTSTEVGRLRRIALDRAIDRDAREREFAEWYYDMGGWKTCHA